MKEITISSILYLILLLSLVPGVNAVIVWNATFNGSEVVTVGWPPYTIIPNYGKWVAIVNNVNGSVGFSGLQVTEATPLGRAGKYAVKVTVNDTTASMKTSSSNRVELHAYDHHDGAYANEVEGDERYYGFSYYFPSGYNSSGWNTMTQWKGINQGYFNWGTNPLVQIQFQSSILKLNVCGGDFGTNRTPGCPANSGSSSISKNIKTFTSSDYNIWHDIILYISWSKTSSGQVKVWYKLGSDTNYTAISSATINGANLQYNSTRPTDYVSFVGFGHYRQKPVPARTDTHYIMQYKIGTTFEDVSYNSTSNPTYYAPIITSWSNSKTGDTSQDLTINVGESVNFTVTANQTISYWNWFLDSVQLS